MVNLNRYSRNHSSITKDENLILRQSKVCVVGCGGLGGHIIEMLARLGVGTITVIDGDVFDETNLNRQILSNELTIGQSKAITAEKRIKIVNSDVKIIPIEDYIDKDNAKGYLKEHQVVIDALDDISIRFILQEACLKLKTPLIHGAIGGWYGQVSTIFPGDNTLDKIYRNNMISGKEKELGNPAFTPTLISSIQVSEAVKVLIGRGELLRNKLLFIDTLNHEYNTLEL